MSPLNMWRSLSQRCRCDVITTEFGVCSEGWEEGLDFAWLFKYGLGPLTPGAACIIVIIIRCDIRVQELCESPGLSVLTSLLVSVDLKQY